MKVKYLFVLALLAGCQKEKTVTAAAAVPEKKTEITLVAEEKFLKTDTIPISEG